MWIWFPKKTKKTLLNEGTARNNMGMRGGQTKLVYIKLY